MHNTNSISLKFRISHIHHFSKNPMLTKKDQNLPKELKKKSHKLISSPILSTLNTPLTLTSKDMDFYLHKWIRMEINSLKQGEIFYKPSNERLLSSTSPNFYIFLQAHDLDKRQKYPSFKIKKCKNKLKIPKKPQTN